MSMTEKIQKVGNISVVYNPVINLLKKPTNLEAQNPTIQPHYPHTKESFSE